MKRTIAILTTTRDGLTTGTDGRQVYLWDTTGYVRDSLPARTSDQASRASRTLIQRHRRLLAADGLTLDPARTVDPVSTDVDTPAARAFTANLIPAPDGLTPPGYTPTLTEQD